MKKILFALTWSLLSSSAHASPKVVTVEEFADLVCHYCGTAEPTIQQLQREFPGKVKIVFRNFPLPSHGEVAATAAKAVSAVQLQDPGLAAQFVAQVFANQARLVHEGESFLFERATALGVDVARMKKDMDGKEVAESLARDLEEAKNLGVEGTPSFRIGQQLIQGARPIEVYRAAVQRELSK